MYFIFSAGMSELQEVKERKLAAAGYSAAEEEQSGAVHTVNAKRFVEVLVCSRSLLQWCGSLFRVC